MMEYYLTMIKLEDKINATRYEIDGLDDFCGTLYPFPLTFDEVFEPASMNTDGIMRWTVSHDKTESCLKDYLSNFFDDCYIESYLKCLNSTASPADVMELLSSDSVLNAYFMMERNYLMDRGLDSIVDNWEQATYEYKLSQQALYDMAVLNLPNRTSHLEDYGVYYENLKLEWPLFLKTLGLVRIWSILYRATLKTNRIVSKSKAFTSRNVISNTH